MKRLQRLWSSWTVVYAWLVLLSVPGAVHAEDLTVHVIDIGGGLCTLTEALSITRVIDTVYARDHSLHGVSPIPLVLNGAL